MDAKAIDHNLLKKCPFCGGAARVVRMHDRYPAHICQIACSNQKCVVGPRTIVLDCERAVVEWNSRPNKSKSSAPNQT